MNDSEYITGYPTKPIGGGNPYYCCAKCGVSEPEINGRLEGHSEWCEWRLNYGKEAEIARLQALVSEAREIISGFQIYHADYDPMVIRARSFLNRTGE